MPPYEESKVQKKTSQWQPNSVYQVYALEIDAVYKKIEQLGLEVVDEEKKNVSTTTSLEFDRQNTQT